MCAELNYMIHENKLQKGNICRLSQFQTNYVKDKHILVILELDILDEYGLPEKLGQPLAIGNIGSRSRIALRRRASPCRRWRAEAPVPSATLA